jgi:hypothetical protein
LPFVYDPAMPGFDAGFFAALATVLRRVDAAAKREGVARAGVNPASSTAVRYSSAPSNPASIRN